MAHEQGTNKSWVSRICYAIGNLGQAAYYNALSTFFVTYYAAQTLFRDYEDSDAKAMIAIITALVFIIRIVEIFIDPLLGNLVDNTNSRFGRFKPWQVIGGVGSSILLFAIFTGLFGLVNVNKGVFIVVFVIVFVVLDVLYSLRDISYWGMIPALSSSSQERSVYTALGTFTGSIGYNGVTAIVVPVVAFFGALAGAGSESQAGWSGFGALIAILGIVTCLAVAFGTREEESVLRDPADKSNPLQAFQAIGRNDQLLWVSLSYVLYSIANVATTGFMIYLFKFVLQKPDIYSVVGIIAFLIGLAVTPLYPVINRRFLLEIEHKFPGDQAKKDRMAIIHDGQVRMAFMACAYILFIFFSTNLVVVFVALVLFYLPATCIQMTAILTITDSVEYGQWKTGKRNEAVTLSVRPMLDKIAGALSNSIVGFVAIVAAMTNDVDPSLLTSSNIETFKAAAFYVPLVVVVLAFIVFARKVTLTEAKHGEIVSILEENMASASDKEG